MEEQRQYSSCTLMSDGWSPDPRSNLLLEDPNTIFEDTPLVLLVRPGIYSVWTIADPARDLDGLGSPRYMPSVISNTIIEPSR